MKEHLIGDSDLSLTGWFLPDLDCEMEFASAVPSGKIGTVVASKGKNENTFISCKKSIISGSAAMEESVETVKSQDSYLRY